MGLAESQLIVGLIDAIVALAATLIGAGLVTREQLAAAYQTAEAQQAAQPVDGAARRLAVHTLGKFFSAPVHTGKPELRLVVDNERSNTAP